MSENKTLIAYATRGGTTEDYAKAINSVLTDEFKMQVDLVNLKNARNPDLTQYQNIIVGAGIRMFRMHKEGAQFLEQRNFGEKNVGIFLSSLVPRDEAIKRYVDVILQKNTTLEPFAVDVFRGARAHIEKRKNGPARSRSTYEVDPPCTRIFNQSTHGKKLTEFPANSIQVKVAEGGKVHQEEEKKILVTKRSEQNNKAMWP